MGAGGAGAPGAGVVLPWRGYTYRQPTSHLTTGQHRTDRRSPHRTSEPRTRRKSLTCMCLHFHVPIIIIMMSYCNRMSSIRSDAGHPISTDGQR